AAERTLADFFREFTDEWMRGDPNRAAATRYFSGEEQAALERQLTPETRAWRHQRVELARRGLAELAKFDTARMSRDERVSAELMRWQLEMLVEGEAYEDYRFPLDQFNGPNVSLVNTLTVQHPMRTSADARSYVARLAQVRPRMEEGIAEAERLAAKRMIPPRFILRSTLAQLEQFIGTPPAGNPLVVTFAEKSAAIDGLGAEEREVLRSQAERIVATDVYPAWKKAIALLESLVPGATDDAGLWRFAGGDKAYAFDLRRFTTTKLPPEAIHDIGLREVKRLEGEMEKVLARLGRTQGSLKERTDTLERELAYPNNDQGRAAIMADIERILRDAEKRSAALFAETPKAPVIARPYPRFRWASAAASYSFPAPDGSRPGIFQIPLRPSQLTRYALRSLVYHETVPGHHFQIALEQENTALPRFRQLRAYGFISAYGEGWALYAERLAAEAGWYEGDDEGLLGQLEDELFRARRLVVDTGLHAKHWTREQAIAYGIGPSEVERYVVYPGQACSYKLGQLKILELRDRARAALGSRYSPKEFHRAVLGTGTVPLELLEHEIDAYIARSK
ncbi:MAG TPA: DUF885 domain-containing protein, partial [Burkholderiales bacterium]|nr:DUF885 domain-containing protein [Burkholderiales bacterium]